jgi:hypothetical protein
MHRLYEDPANREVTGPARRRRGKYTEIVPVRLDPVELDRVRNSAAEQDQSVSAWIRGAIRAQLDPSEGTPALVPLPGPGSIVVPIADVVAAQTVLSAEGVIASLEAFVHQTESRLNTLPSSLEKVFTMRRPHDSDSFMVLSRRPPTDFVNQLALDVNETRTSLERLANLQSLASEMNRQEVVKGLRNRIAVLRREVRALDSHILELPKGPMSEQADVGLRATYEYIDAAEQALAELDDELAKLTGAS